MRILLTAFEPYHDWKENASWLAMVELLKNRPANVELVTRRYPVEMKSLQERLRKDLELPFDAILHIGQAPGSAVIQLESIALNYAGPTDKKGEQLDPIIAAGPTAYATAFPLGKWAHRLRSENVPAIVSYHAGTFLCNATMYLTHFLLQSLDLKIPCTFVHVPLTTEQVCSSGRSLPSLPVSTLAKGIRILVDELTEGYQQTTPTQFA